jgi:hypothetical protein
MMAAPIDFKVQYARPYEVSLSICQCEVIKHQTYH